MADRTGAEERGGRSRAARLDADDARTPMGGVGPQRDHAYFARLRRRLRRRLLVAYVTPLLVLAAYFHYQYADTLRRGVQNHLCSIAENQRNTVDLFLKVRIANLRAAFGAPGWRSPEAPMPLAELLDDLQRESPTFVDVGLFGPGGELTAYAGPFPSLVGKDYGEEAWFQAVHASERGHFTSDVYLGFRGQPHFIIAVARRFGGEGWVLRATLDPQRFADLVGRSALFSDAETLIVNARGVLQTLPKGADVQTAMPPPPPRSTLPAVEELVVGGGEVVRATAWLAENDWAVVVQVPSSVAYAQLRVARLVLVGLLALALALIALVVRSSTRRLVARLERAYSTKHDLTLQLFNAAKLASVGEMAAGVAHEINNPLAIVYEEASMILDTLDPAFGLELKTDDLTERVEAIRDATMRGRAITSKLLAFARQGEPDPAPVDLCELIERVLAVKRSDFHVSDIGVERDLEDGLPEVVASGNQLEQVLLNLLNNARDAMGGRGGTIRVSARRVGDAARIEVADTGTGMPKEVLERVFFPFFTTKGVGRGTGLGLSISYGIVKAHGGRIEVVSEVGVGTTVAVELPLASAAPLRLPSDEASFAA